MVECWSGLECSRLREGDTVGSDNSKRGPENNGAFPVRLEDIAREAGVSKVTVGRVMNDSGGSARVGEETTARVRQIAERMGYERNRIATILAKQRTNLIGVVVPNFDIYFYGHYLAVLERKLQQHDLMMLPLVTETYPTREREQLRLLPQQMLDGLICIEYDWHNAGVYAELNCDLPLVARIYNNSTQDVAFSVVRVCYEESVRRLASCLREQGCSQVAVSGARPPHQELRLEWRNPKNRLIRDGLAEAGIGVREDRFTVVQNILGEPWTPMDALHDALRDMLLGDPEIDAILVTGGELVAVTAAACESAGRRAGSDIKLVSWGGIPGLRYAHPPASCVIEEPFEAVTDGLVELIMERIAAHHAKKTRCPEARDVRVASVFREQTLV